jgi:aspartate/methionine/tyrosine aminotransferase
VFQYRDETPRPGAGPIGPDIGDPDLRPRRATIHVHLPILRRLKFPLDFTRVLSDPTGVVVFPGSGFGPAGGVSPRIAPGDSEARPRGAGGRMANVGLRH